MKFYTKRKMYNTKAHMGMIDLTEEVKQHVQNSGIKNGIITIYVAGCTAAITTIEYEPGLVNHDIAAFFDKIAPYRDEKGNIIPYEHHKTWGDDNGSSHLKSMLLGPSLTVPIVDGEPTIGPWQNYVLVECDTRDRRREVIFHIMGE